MRIDEKPQFYGKANAPGTKMNSLHPTRAMIGKFRSRMAPRDEAATLDQAISEIVMTIPSQPQSPPPGDQIPRKSSAGCLMVTTTFTVIALSTAALGG